MHKEYKIILTGGGTGGHIYPLLAVLKKARELLPEAKFTYFGSGLDFEQKIIVREKIEYRRIFCGKFRRNLSLLSFARNVVDFLKFIAGFFQSIFEISRIRPDLIFSKGGYVSLPVVIAARFFKVPIILHESDAMIGLANRATSRFARRVLLAFPVEICDKNTISKSTYSGLPLRDEFEQIYKNHKDEKGSYLLIVGGSSGAMSLNSKFFKVGEKILEKTPVVHITGKEDSHRAKKFREMIEPHLREKYTIYDYSEKMSDLISKAKVVVTRAGATAIFEAAACRKSILACPLPKEVGYHQIANCEFLKQANMAKVHSEDESPQQFQKDVLELIDQNSSKLSELYFPNSAGFIAQILSDELEKARLEKIKNVFLIGTCGVSMHGIELILKAMGKNVSGSDLKVGGHSAKNINCGVNLVVYSAAAGPDSSARAEHQKAENLGIEKIKRAQMVGWMMRGYEGISVSGMHGKTTITNLLAIAFEQAGIDPSYLIGADESSNTKPAHLGHGKIFISEACEYDGSFLEFPTYIAVISNIEKEHLDYFKGGLPDIKNHFSRFIRAIYPGGALIFCGDDVNAFQVVKSNIDYLENKKIRIVSYGFKPSNDICIRNYSVGDGGAKFRITSKSGDYDFSAQIPGKHFAQNTAAVLAVSSLYQVAPELLQIIIRSYRGASRRFNLVAERNKLLIYDDYAHHPTEIKATLDALNELYRKRRKIIVFQPHQQNRLNNLFEDFSRVLKSAPIEKVAILPVFRVPGRDDVAKFSSEDLVLQINKMVPEKAIYLSDYTEAVGFLSAISSKDDIIMTMGATDVWKVGEQFIKNYKL